MKPSDRQSAQALIREILISAGILLILWVCMPAEGRCGDIYDQDIKPLSTIECARCHYPVFLSLKNHGGKHRQECGECHETYHNFRRGLKWEDRVPACTGCHDTPHGDSPEMKACLKCHENAHAPVYSIKLSTIEPLCGKCHAKPAEQLSKYPSAHSDLSCTDCHHDRHGVIPKCTECHEEPHSKFVDNAHCTRCHPVHMPTNLNYGPHIPNDACADCHNEQFTMLKNGILAHSEMKCVTCHSDEHGNVPSCEDCHGKPHTEEMLKDHKACSDCHGDVHDLKPVK